MKEASGDLSQIADILSMADGSVDVYSGNDDQIVPILSLGGKGVISVLSNIAPRQTHDICQKYFEGNVKVSAKLQLRSIELIHALFCEVNPIPVKYGLSLLGYQTGPLRKPLTELEQPHKEGLEKAMRGYQLL